MYFNTFFFPRYSLIRLLEPAPMFHLLDNFTPPDGKQLHSVKTHILLRIQNIL